jgi:gluconolactonase
MFQTNRLEKSLQRARFCDLLSFRKNPDLIAFTLLAAAGIFATGCSTSQKESAPIWASDETPKELLSSGAGEGPAWHPELGMLFSGDGNIQRWNPETGELSVFREGAGTNGLLFDYQGRLLACEPKQRQVTRLELDGSLTVLTSHYRGSQYNAPNDITTDANGRIYFSDPKYGDRSGLEMLDDQGTPVEGVYLIRKNGTVERIITHEVDRPNGVLVSSDQKYLYVADNNNNTVGGAHQLWRFKRKSDGTLNLKSQKLIFDWKTSRGPDGMVQDEQGRIYVAAGLNKDNLPFETKLPYAGGVFVFSKSGVLLDHLPIPNDEVTNCAFGGEALKTLFITAGGHLWSIRTSIAGELPWPKPHNTELK